MKRMMSSRVEHRLFIILKVELEQEINKSIRNLSTYKLVPRNLPLVFNN